MDNSTPLYFDLEATWGRHDSALATVTLGAWALGDGPVQIGTPDQVREALYRYRGHPLVGHNIAYDIAHIQESARAALPPVPVYDTHIRGILAQAAAGEHAAAGASLKDLARRVGYSMPAKDKKVTRSFGSVRSPADLTPVQRQYVIDDVEATRAVFLKQGGPARVPDEARQTELALHTFEMARRGLHIDGRYRYELHQGAKLAVDAAYLRVKDAGLIQPRGPKKNPWRDSAVDQKLVQARLLVSGAKRLAESGKLLAADEEALRASKDPGLLALADYSASRKHLALIEGYVYTDDENGKQVPIEGDTIRAWWRPLVASGRLSCAAPNVSQIPKKGGLRELLTPSPGNKLVIADFNALEFRAWASVAEKMVGRSMAAKLLREGVDVHTYMGEHVRRVRPELTAKEARALAKVLNFGLIGGMGSKRLAEALSVPGQIADQLIWVWRDAFPEAELYFEIMKRKVDGYPFYKVAIPGSGRIRRGFYSEVANVLIQGTGADIAKDGLRLAHQAGLPVVALIHDSYLLDVPAASAEEAGHTLLRCMEEAGKMHCPTIPWTAQKFEVLGRWYSVA